MGDPELIHDTNKALDILFHSIFDGKKPSSTGNVEILNYRTVSEVEGMFVQA
jgi:hypothetical protein